MQFVRLPVTIMNPEQVETWGTPTIDTEADIFIGSISAVFECQNGSILLLSSGKSINVRLSPNDVRKKLGELGCCFEN